MLEYFYEYFHLYFENLFNFLILISFLLFSFLIFCEYPDFYKASFQFSFTPLSSNLYLLPISPFKHNFTPTFILMPHNLHIHSLCFIFFLLVGIFKSFFLTSSFKYFSITFGYMYLHISIPVFCPFYSVVAPLNVLVHFSCSSLPTCVLKFWLNNSRPIYHALILSQFLVLYIRVDSDLLYIVGNRNNNAWYCLYYEKILFPTISRNNKNNNDDIKKHNI